MSNCNMISESFSFKAQARYLVGDENEEKNYTTGTRPGGLLAMSNKYGYVYYAIKNYIYAVKFSHLEDQFDDFEELHTVDSEELVTHKMPGDVIHLSLSKSELYISACYDNTLSIFSAKEIAKNSDSWPLVDEIKFEMTDVACCWNKAGSDKLAIIAKDTLRVWEPLLGIEAMLHMPSCTSCDWSPSQNNLLIARDNDVYIKDSSLHKDIATYKEVFSDSSACIHHLNWLKEDQFIACSVSKHCPDTSPSLEIFTICKDGRSNRLVGEGVNQEVCDSSAWTYHHPDQWASQQLYFTRYFEPWKLVLVASNRCDNVRLLQCISGKWKIVDPHDEILIKFEDSAYRSSFPTGMAISLNATIEVYLVDDDIPPQPVVITLSTSGHLLLHSIIDTTYPDPICVEPTDISTIDTVLVQTPKSKTSVGCNTATARSTESESDEPVFPHGTSCSTSNKPLVSGGLSNLYSPTSASTSSSENKPISTTGTSLAGTSAFGSGVTGSLFGRKSEDSVNTQVPAKQTETYAPSSSLFGSKGGGIVPMMGFSKQDNQHGFDPNAGLALFRNTNSQQSNESNIFNTKPSIFGQQNLSTSDKTGSGGAPPMAKAAPSVFGQSNPASSDSGSSAGAPPMSKAAPSVFGQSKPVSSDKTGSAGAPPMAKAAPSVFGQSKPASSDSGGSAGAPPMAKAAPSVFGQSKPASSDKTGSAGAPPMAKAAPSVFGQSKPASSDKTGSAGAPPMSKAAPSVFGQSKPASSDSGSSAGAPPMSKAAPSVFGQSKPVSSDKTGSAGAPPMAKAAPSVFGQSKPASSDSGSSAGAPPMAKAAPSVFGQSKPVSSDKTGSAGAPPMAKAAPSVFGQSKPASSDSGSSAGAPPMAKAAPSVFGQSKPVSSDKTGSAGAPPMAKAAPSVFGQSKPVSSDSGGSAGAPPMSKAAPSVFGQSKPVSSDKTGSAGAPPMAKAAPSVFGQSKPASSDSGGSAGAPPMAKAAPSVFGQSKPANSDKTGSAGAPPMAKAAPSVFGQSKPVSSDKTGSAGAPPMAKAAPSVFGQSKPVSSDKTGSAGAPPMAKAAPSVFGQSKPVSSDKSSLSLHSASQSSVSPLASTGQPLSRTVSVNSSFESPAGIPATQASQRQNRPRPTGDLSALECPDAFADLVKKFNSKLCTLESNSIEYQLSLDSIGVEFDNRIASLVQQTKKAVRTMRKVHSDCLDSLRTVCADNAVLYDVSQQIKEASDIMNPDNRSRYMTMMSTIDLDPIASRNRDNIKSLLDMITMKLQSLQASLERPRIVCKDNLFHSLKNSLRHAQNAKNVVAELERNVGALEAEFGVINSTSNRRHGVDVGRIDCHGVSFSSKGKVSCEIDRTARLKGFRYADIVQRARKRNAMKSNGRVAPSKTAVPVTKQQLAFECWRTATRSHLSDVRYISSSKEPDDEDINKFEERQKKSEELVAKNIKLSEKKPGGSNSFSRTSVDSTSKQNSGSDTSSIKSTSGLSISVASNAKDTASTGVSSSEYSPSPNISKPGAGFSTSFSTFVKDEKSDPSSSSPNKEPSKFGTSFGSGFKTSTSQLSKPPVESTGTWGKKSDVEASRKSSPVKGQLNEGDTKNSVDEAPSSALNFGASFKTFGVSETSASRESVNTSDKAETDKRPVALNSVESVVSSPATVSKPFGKSIDLKSPTSSGFGMSQTSTGAVQTKDAPVSGFAKSTLDDCGAPRKPPTSSGGLKGWGTGAGSGESSGESSKMAQQTVFSSTEKASSKTTPAAKSTPAAKTTTTSTPTPFGQTPSNANSVFSGGTGGFGAMPSKNQGISSSSASSSVFGQKSSPGLGTPQQVTSEAPDTVEAIRTRLYEIYKEHCPAKVEKIPDLLQKYKGNEKVLLQRAEEKYIVTPSRQQSATQGGSSFGQSSKSTPQQTAFGMPQHSTPQQPNNPQQGSVFAQASSKSTGFSQPNQKQSTPQQSVFGTPQQSQATPFGQSKSSPFGQAKQTPFGQSQQGGFSQQQTTPQQSGFGQQQTTPQQGGFGQQQTTPQQGGFGQQQTTPQQGGFGQQQTTPQQGGFGQQQATPQQNSVFGNQQSQGTVFGGSAARQSSQPTPFSAGSQQSAASPFGSSTAKGAFGQSTGIGQSSTPSFGVTSKLGNGGVFGNQHSSMSSGKQPGGFGSAGGSSLFGQQGSDNTQSAGSFSKPFASGQGATPFAGSQGSVFGESRPLGGATTQQGGFASVMNQQQQQSGFGGGGGSLFGGGQSQNKFQGASFTQMRK